MACDPDQIGVAWWIEEPARRGVTSGCKDAEFLVLDGTLESPPIEFRIVQPGER